MPTMAAGEYMRTRRTRVGIWLVAMAASNETANGREHGTTSTRRKTRLPNARKASWTKVTYGTRSHLTRKLKPFHGLLYKSSKTAKWSSGYTDMQSSLGQEAKSSKTAKWSSGTL
jgi:hypothetical protein